MLHREIWQEGVTVRSSPSNFTLIGSGVWVHGPKNFENWEFFCADNRSDIATVVPAPTASQFSEELEEIRVAESLMSLQEGPGMQCSKSKVLVLCATDHF